MFTNDPYRPRYHFAQPGRNGDPGDPNGAFFADGRYHLMYLYHHEESDSFRWGHVSSEDLLHWHHHPDALSSLNGDRGCNSGGAFVDEDGTAYLTFWKFASVDSSDNGGIGIAKSTPPYDDWERMTPLAVYGTDWGWTDMEIDGEIKHVACADPSNVWKVGDTYYFQTGNCPILDAYGRGQAMDPRWRKSEVALPEYQGDWTDLFRSKDLKTWEYAHRFYQNPKRDETYPDDTEDDMCPTLLPLPSSEHGGTATDLYLQSFLSHNRGAHYYVGTLENERFYPTEHGRFSWTDKACGVPEAMVDGRGRQLIWFWLVDNLENDFRTYGWSGVFSFPRVLWYDGGLKMAPACELDALQTGEQAFSVGTVNGTVPLAVTNGTSFRLKATIQPQTATRCGFRILAAPNGEQYVDIAVDRTGEALTVDLSHCGDSPWAVCERAPFSLAPNEPIELDIFVDRSVIEVYANRRQAVCRRAYPTDPTRATGVFAIADGADFGTVTAYEMTAAE